MYLSLTEKDFDEAVKSIQAHASYNGSVYVIGTRSQIDDYLQRFEVAMKAAIKRYCEK